MNLSLCVILFACCLQQDTLNERWERRKFYVSQNRMVSSVMSERQDSDGKRKGGNDKVIFCTILNLLEIMRKRV
jgi:hypothetical protein